MLNIIQQSHKIITPKNWIKDYVKITEEIARTCYKSESRIKDDSGERLIKSLINRGHGAMLEHMNLSVRFITDRGVTHELVRHRHAAYAQESTRFVKYNNIEFIDPGFEGIMRQTWKTSCIQSKECYKHMIDIGAKPQDARATLNHSVKTEIVATAGIREWREIFRLRTAKDAHQQMRALMIPVLNEFKKLMPVFFGDLESFDA